MSHVRFRTVIELAGRTATGFEVPTDAVRELGSSKKPAVVVRLPGYSYRSTVATMGGRFLVPLSAEHRTAAGLSAGDEVEVALELDTAPREVEVPEDFAAALKSDERARSRFEAISYSRKRAHVLSIEGAKTPETRARRITKALDALREEPG